MADIREALAPSRSGFTPGRIGGIMVACPIPFPMEALILVATHGGPTMFARIGVMRALNRHHVREFNPKHKEPHWGRRKLKRDQ
jgi:hypothetical protein